jgi:hypothetical protein
MKSHQIVSLVALSMAVACMNRAARGWGKILTHSTPANILTMKGNS